MEIQITENDLRSVINQQAAEIANLKAINAALGRTIQELEINAASGDVHVDNINGAAAGKSAKKQDPRVTGQMV